MKSVISIMFLMILSHAFTYEDDIELTLIHKYNGQLVAFGDFNSDALIDIFIITDKGQSVEIMFGSDKEFMQPNEQIKCTFHERRITSVVPGDFNGDALMDALVTVKNTSKTELNEDTNDVYILRGNLSSLKCPEKNQQPIFAIIDQPLVIDYDGNMIMDLFGVKKLPNGEQKMFWLFDSNGDFQEKPMEIMNSRKSNMKIPQSHGYLDVEGDNAPDLYLTTDDGYEVWVSEDGSFRYDKSISKPDACVIGQSVFIDLQLQGRLDNVVPVCSDANCTESTIYFHDSKNWHDLKVNFTKDGLRFVPTRRNSPYLETITLRPGDFNMDGYIDLLATVCERDSEKTKVILLKNTECNNCNGFSRTFKIEQIFDSKDYGNNHVMGAFYDFSQNGVLDVLLIREVNGDYEMNALKSSLTYDAYFLKVMVITGLNNNNHKAVSYYGGQKSFIFGVNLPGPKVIYEAKNYQGVDRKGVAIQLPQSAYFSLHLPYTIFGLGRFCNFITRLSVSVLNETRDEDSIIPNAQIVIIPHPLNEPSDWKTKLFVTPSRIILQSALVFAGTCLLLLFTIGMLQYQERKVDRKKKWEDSGAISVFR